MGTGKPIVGATLVVARLGNPDIGGKPAGRPQGSPLQRPFLYPQSEPLRNLAAHAERPENGDQRGEPQEHHQVEPRAGQRLPAHHDARKRIYSVTEGHQAGERLEPLRHLLDGP